LDRQKRKLISTRRDIEATGLNRCGLGMTATSAGQISDVVKATPTTDH
jgi:hypothetical protein